MRTKLDLVLVSQPASKDPAWLKKGTSERAPYLKQEEGYAQFPEVRLHGLQSTQHEAKLTRSCPQEGGDEVEGNGDGHLALLGLEGGREAGRERGTEGTVPRGGRRGERP